jgi:chromosome segregation ATPase
MAQALKEMGYGDGKNAINRWRLAEWNVLNQICKAHGIEISEPKKSRGFDFTSEEYKAYQDEIHALEDAKDRAESELLDTQDELKKASEKKSKLTKIDSIETKKSVFGNKVSLLQEDYDELVTLAKKQIASVKNNKKLKSEKETLLGMVADYEKKVKDLESELAQYKKPATISRDVLKKQAKEISEKEQLKIKLRKAMAVIDAYGLHEEYERIKVNSTKNRNELE